MARSNVTARTHARTHEGAPAVPNPNALTELRRSCLAALLFESLFYESGSAHAARVAGLVNACDPVAVAALAIEAREQQHLRHLPLFLVACLAGHPAIGAHAGLAGRTLERVIQRPDEIAEFCAIYWAKAGREDGAQRKPGTFVLPRGCRRALGRAFGKFNAYSLGKYKGETKAIKLADVLRMARPKPKDAEQSALWKALRTGTLKSTDTWETELSAGNDKKATFERLLTEGKLGGLATLRNLRNMEQAGVDRALILTRLQGEFKRVLPFRFIAAAHHAPSLAQALGEAMERQLGDEAATLAGTTIVLVDVSGSMEGRLSAKSELSRLDAACALATLARARGRDVRVFSFSDHLVEVPNYRGMALMQAIPASQPNSSTYLGQAVTGLNDLRADRLIVITDEQSHDSVPASTATHAYMVNVGAYQHGVGFGPWVRISGFSERLLDFVAAHEAPDSAA